MKKPKQTTLIINNKDIVRITGKSSRTACRIIEAIRKKHKANTGSSITIKEFCEHMRLDETSVLRHIR